MSVSIVIPTRNRSEDLRELLKSILMQTALPKEVIIVDDSDDDKVKVLTEQMYDDFSNKNVALKYLRGAGKGISAARNIGAAQASGTIYCGVDDDVILDKDYLKEILNIYKKHPSAVGVGGYVTNFRRFPALKNSLNKIFFLSYTEEDNCRILLSGKPTYPSSLSRVIKCDWLDGTNSCYKMEVLRDFKYDENLRGYSLGEDKAISYSIRICHPDSLYMTPRAQVIHKNSPVARRNAKYLSYTGIVYPTYFFHNYLKHTILNVLIFIWSMFGRFVIDLISNRGRPREILFLIHAYTCTLKHLKKVKDGNFSFLEPR